MLLEALPQENPSSVGLKLANYHSLNLNQNLIQLWCSGYRLEKREHHTNTVTGVSLPCF